MKYNRAHEMFNDLMNFALRNGMDSYQSDLMHDAVEICRIEDCGTPARLTWVVKSNGCGTWMWNHKDGEAPKVIEDSGVSVEIIYNGEYWTAERIY